MQKEIHCCKCNNIDFFKVEADPTRLFILPNRYLTVKLKPKSHNPIYTIPLTQYTCLKCGYVWFRVDDKNNLNTISKLYDELE